MNYAFLKSMHVIFVVAWFAGLFYLVRLFVYHAEAESRPDDEKRILQEQYKIMERRLWYGITWPAMVGTFVFGFWLAYQYELFSSTWLWIKLSLVLGLLIYHLFCGRIRWQMGMDIIRYTSGQLRLLNEVATFFLVAIVFIVEFKNALNALWAVFGFLIFGAALFAGIKIYSRIRKS